MLAFCLLAFAREPCSQAGKHRRLAPSIVILLAVAQLLQIDTGICCEPVSKYPQHDFVSIAHLCTFGGGIFLLCIDVKGALHAAKKSKSKVIGAACLPPHDRGRHPADVHNSTRLSLPTFEPVELARMVCEGAPRGAACTTDRVSVPAVLHTLEHLSNE